MCIDTTNFYFYFRAKDYSVSLEKLGKLPGNSVLSWRTCVRFCINLCVLHTRFSNLKIVQTLWVLTDVWFLQNFDDSELLYFNVLFFRRKMLRILSTPDVAPRRIALVPQLDASKPKIVSLRLLYLFKESDICLNCKDVIVNMSLLVYLMTVKW